MSHDEKTMIFRSFIKAKEELLKSDMGKALGFQDQTEFKKMINLSGKKFVPFLTNQEQLTKLIEKHAVEYYEFFINTFYYD